MQGSFRLIPPYKHNKGYRLRFIVHPSSLPNLQTKLNLGVVVCVLRDSVQTLISGRVGVAWVKHNLAVRGIQSILFSLGMCVFIVVWLDGLNLRLFCALWWVSGSECARQVNRVGCSYLIEVE